MVALRPRKSSGMLPPRPARPGSAAPPRATSVGRLLANSSLAHFPPRNSSGCAATLSTADEPGPHPALAPHLPHCAQVDESSAGMGPVFAMCHLWSEVMFMPMAENHLLAGHREPVPELSPPRVRPRRASRTEGPAPFAARVTQGTKRPTRGAGGSPSRHGRKTPRHQKRNDRFLRNSESCRPGGPPGRPASSAPAQTQKTPPPGGRGLHVTWDEWRWRESNPRPTVQNQGFSVCSSL